MPGPAPAVAATRLAVRQALRDGWAAPPKGRDLPPHDEVSPEGRDLALHDASTCDVPEGRDSASRRARPPRPTKDETTIVEGGGDLPPRAAPGGPHDGLVLVACSGGPDSLALAAATAFVAPRLGWRAGAVVVDHGLQDGSAQVAARAAEQCRGLGLDPVLVRPVQVGTEGGPEAAARTARYAALEAAAAALGADVVLLGHTLDDQAEQVLLALARGSGARSLAGMPDRRGIYRRPFLGLGRAVTSAACAAQDLTPWDDPTNSTGAGRRTRVRTEVMPLLVDVLGPGVVPALARTADQLRDAADAVDDAATALLATSRADDGSVPVEALAQAPAAVRRAALRTLALAAGSPAGSLGARHVTAVEALVVDWHGQGPIHLPGAVVARRDCGRLQVVPGATSAGPTSAGHQTRADG